MDKLIKNFKHGINGYNYGCRCFECKTDKSIKRKQYESADAKERQRQNAAIARKNPMTKAQKQAYDKKRHKERYDSAASRWRTIFRKYKLTEQQYEQLLVSQNNGCAICGGKSSRSFLSVDHDHACCPGNTTCGNCIRGLLCQSCNAFLGRVNDNLDSAYLYLKKNKESR